MFVRFPKQVDSTKIIQWFFTLYLLSCGFQHILYFPILGDKIQLPELIFVAGIMFSLKRHEPKSNFIKSIELLKTPTALFPLIWSIVHLLSSTLHPSTLGWLECAGIMYLLLVFLFFYAQFKNLPHPIFKEVILSAFSILGWMMSVMALGTYLLSIFWKPNYTAQVFYNYPYFGDVIRLQGFTTTPAMYISVISLPIGFCLYNFLFGSKKNIDLIASIFFSIVAFFTFSKSALFIVFIWMALLAFKKKLNKWISVLIGIFILIIHIFLTHFLVLTQDERLDKQFINGPYTSNDCLIQTSSYALCGSGYYQFKKTAVQIFADHIWLGIGPGNYNTAVLELKNKGLYPQNLPAYDPHSSPLGTLATTGLIGFTAWMALIVLVIRRLKNIESFGNSFSHLLWVLTMVVFAESISMDIMNFRHYWILALILAVTRKE